LRRRYAGSGRGLSHVFLARFGGTMRLHLILLATATCLTLPSASAAQDLVVASKPEAIVALLQKAGMQATLDKDDEGNPLILSAASGANYDLYFYECKDGKDCGSVEFSACFDMPDGVKMDVINTWNYEWRFGKASLDENNDPCLHMDVELLGGVSELAFNTSIDTWTGTLGRFTTAIGY
jgi:hypothetical protein